MSPQVSPPWTTGFQSRRRGANPGMRVSDAERSEVADRLSRHYSDGRLDQAEFDDRLHRAMNAKTQGDFAGLFDDLPDLPGDGSGPDAPRVDAPRAHQDPVRVSRRRPGAPLDRVLFFVFVVVAAIVLGHALVHSFLIWVLVALIALLVLRSGIGRRHS
ncbi:MAG TPA: DUF1707 domain-containing protein [Streptosporangiaceae bacterium]|nr:DUF1707 domain-containing protein [Streptosporangiaceae bacterium]